MCPQSHAKNGFERKIGGSSGFSIRLQAVLVAWDCNPRWLIKHLPSLAASRNVPIIHVKDHKQGTVKLVELISLRTAIAIGVKEKGSGINRLVETLILHAEQELTPALKRNVSLT
ncbi:hypothetical protein Dimus_028668 [Dionaea muscipula]